MVTEKDVIDILGLSMMFEIGRLQVMGRAFRYGARFRLVTFNQGGHGIESVTFRWVDVEAIGCGTVKLDWRAIVPD